MICYINSPEVSWSNFVSYFTWDTKDKIFLSSDGKYEIFLSNRFGKPKLAASELEKDRDRDYLYLRNVVVKTRAEAIKLMELFKQVYPGLKGKENSTSFTKDSGGYVANTKSVDTFNINLNDLYSEDIEETKKEEPKRTRLQRIGDFWSGRKVGTEF